MDQYILLLAVVLALGCLTGDTLRGINCSALENEIMDGLEKINYCMSDSDCKLSEDFLGCPFGCYHLINKGENLVDLKKLANRYQGECEKCFYKCGMPPSQEEINCIKGKCMDSRY